MGMYINTNIAALTAERNLSATSTSYQSSVQKLSSGLRINSAADDAAGLSISEKLQAQVNGLDQAQRNAQDGISLIQTAGGALNNITNMLQRMRELAVQASNGTLTTNDESAISQEMTNLNAEITRTAQTTQFNSISLLQGLGTTVASGGLVAGATGATSGVVVSAVDVSGAAASTTYNMAFNSGAGTVTLTNATTNVAQTLTLGAMTASTSNTQVLNFDQLGVKLTLSGDSANGTVANIGADLQTLASLTTSGTSGLNLQIGANANQTVTLNIANVNASNIGNVSGTYLSTAVSNFAGSLTTAKAEALIQNIDQAITDVSNANSGLGAMQNRLQDTISNLSVGEQNMTSAESSIRDVNMAAEMVNFTKTGILQQAGQAILAQANQAPSGIVQLLRG